MEVCDVKNCKGGLLTVRDYDYSPYQISVGPFYECKSCGTLLCTDHVRKKGLTSQSVKEFSEIEIWNIDNLYLLEFCDNCSK